MYSFLFSVTSLINNSLKTSSNFALNVTYSQFIYPSTDNQRPASVVPDSFHKAPWGLSPSKAMANDTDNNNKCPGYIVDKL